MSFLVGSSSQCWIAHPHLAQQKLPSSVCLWVNVPCLCNWRRRITTMKQTPKTDWSGFCLQQLKKQQRAVSSAAAQWITVKLPASEENAFFSLFVLGCFLHKQLSPVSGFLSWNYWKKNANSDQQKSANYTANELRANALILRETLKVSEIQCSPQPCIRLMSYFWERECKVKADVLSMQYIQLSVKSPQVTFNNPLPCCKHLKHSLTGYETSGKWSQPQHSPGQPCWPMHLSCHSLQFFWFHSVLGEFFFPGQKLMKYSLHCGFLSHCSFFLPLVFVVGSPQDTLYWFSVHLVPVCSFGHHYIYIYI